MKSEKIRKKQQKQSEVKLFSRPITITQAGVVLTKGGQKDSVSDDGDEEIARGPADSPVRRHPSTRHRLPSAISNGSGETQPPRQGDSDREQPSTLKLPTMRSLFKKYFGNVVGRAMLRALRDYGGEVLNWQKRGRKIINEIEEKKPDLLLLAEYDGDADYANFISNSGDLPQGETTFPKALSKLGYKHFVVDVDPKRGGGGLALFSKFAITSKEAHPITGTRNILSAEVDVPGWPKKLRVFGVYLTTKSQATSAVYEDECKGFWKAADGINLNDRSVVAAGDFNKDIRAQTEFWPCTSTKQGALKLAVGNDPDEISYKSSARDPEEGMLDFILASSDLTAHPYKPIRKKDVEQISGIPNRDIPSDHFPVAVTLSPKS
jgi:endonuclease/exonuclease/phosphatase family metal-dependent hydrolase